MTHDLLSPADDGAEPGASASDSAGTAESVLTVLSSGGNQRYIFATNKRRQNVGASYLLAQTPEWVRTALTKVGRGEADVVVNASGAAYLLLPDAKTAYAVISSVTQAALTYAPGLELYGWHEPGPSDGHLKERIPKALRKLEQCRVELPPVLLRHPGTPFSAACAFSTGAASARPISLPVSTESGGKRNEPHYCSPPVRAALEVAGKALDPSEHAADSWQVQLKGTSAAAAVPTDGTVDDELGEGSWLAVVHADGNGFGQMFTDLDVAGADGYITGYRALSQRLDAIAHVSLAKAITAVHNEYLEAHEGRGPAKVKPWILPLVVGGDDLTAMVAGPWARRFTEAYLTEFQSQCEAHDLTRGRGLSASAGIAVVKSGYPFYDAYGIAEKLTKAAKDSGRDAGRYDLQVVHDSGGTDLKEIRSSSPGMADLLPVQVTHLSAQGGVASGARVSTTDLHASLELLPRAFSRSVRHRVRDALVSGNVADVQASVLARLRTSTSTSERRQADTAKEWFEKYAGTCGLLSIDLLDLEGEA